MSDFENRLDKILCEEAELSQDDSIDEVLGVLNYIHLQHEEGDEKATKILDAIAQYIKGKGSALGINSSMIKRSQMIANRIPLLKQTFRDLANFERDEQEEKKKESD
jgi:acyl-[acyl carrier protein]--UDP-N-acetylglucosamine O-acyltransferase